MSQKVYQTELFDLLCDQTFYSAINYIIFYYTTGHKLMKMYKNQTRQFSFRLQLKKNTFLMEEQYLCGKDEHFIQLPGSV